MKRRSLIFGMGKLLALSGCAGARSTPSSPGSAAWQYQNPRHWERHIQEFESRDRETPPPVEPVVFVGSSTVVYWTTLPRDFPFTPTLNRGFGGSTIPDLTYYADRILLPYQPRAVVLYSGDNDVAFGASPEQTRDNVARFAQKVWQVGLRNTPILVLAIKPSPERWEFWERMRRANTLIQDWSEAPPGTAIPDRGRVIFVDTASAMLDESGQPRVELYGPDGLHLSARGYRLWTEILGPALQSTLNQGAGGSLSSIAA